jgi:hypothetical protein
MMSKEITNSDDASKGSWVWWVFLLLVTLVPLHFFFRDVLLLKLAANASVLIIGGTLIIAYSSWVSGDPFFILHFGWLGLIVVVGLALFFWFGWVSTLATLGVEAVRAMLGALIERRFVNNRGSWQP